MKDRNCCVDKSFISVFALRDFQMVLELLLAWKSFSLKRFHGTSVDASCIVLIFCIGNDKKKPGVSHTGNNQRIETNRSRGRGASTAKWKIACTEAVCRGLHYQERCRHRYFMELTGGGQIQRLRFCWKIALPLPFPPENVLTYNITEKILSRTAERNSDAV